MTRTDQARHTRLAVSLMHSAMGDLLLNNRGNLCYSYDFDLDGNDLPRGQRRAGAELALISFDGWTLTADGAQFILENCSFEKRDLRFLQAVGLHRVPA